MSPEFDSVAMAIDCDLHRIHAWCSMCGEVCHNTDSLDAVIDHLDIHKSKRYVYPKVLYEIASPVSGKRAGESSAIIYNIGKWMIYNAAIAADLESFLEGDGLVSSRPNSWLWVAPSNIWTKGYDLKTRHTLAKADAKNKDLRECQSMLFFHKHEPERWVPFGKYLGDL